MLQVPLSLFASCDNGQRWLHILSNKYTALNKTAKYREYQLQQVAKLTPEKRVMKPYRCKEIVGMNLGEKETQQNKVMVKRQKNSKLAQIK